MSDGGLVPTLALVLATWITADAVLGRVVARPRRPPQLATARAATTEPRARRSSRPPRRWPRTAGRTVRRPAISSPQPEEAATWLDEVARRVRTGSSLRQAVMDADVGPTFAAHVDALCRRLDRGASLGDAAQWWLDGPAADDEVASTTAAVLVVTDDVGGQIAVPLERAAVSMRSRAAERDERAGWAAQARLSAQVLAALPIGVLGVLAVSDDDVVRILLSPIGTTIVVVGVALDALGFWWMHRIVRIGIRGGVR
ncbi:MAG: type II secretion system F family protein [Actinomycetota bacterium]